VRLLLSGTAFSLLLLLLACADAPSNNTQPPPQNFSLTVTVAGTGTVSSGPTGINCPTTCTASFQSGTSVTLTATAGSGFQFGSYGGACSGNSCTVTLSSNQSVSATFTPIAPHITVAIQGQGTVTSSPSGINCPSTCTANFSSGVTVTLTATPANGYNFSGFAGDCSGTNCQLALSNGEDAEVTANFPPHDITSVNHIIVMLQENRSFDHYFGHLMDYWKAHNYPQATNYPDFDGEPATSSNLDSAGAAVQAYNLQSSCQENPSPSWNESHGDRNLQDPTNPNNAPMDGFVHAAAGDASGDGLYDVLGHRVMGYFTGDNQLNYYYFMASNFATSDRWFAPMMSRTHVNRMYLYGGTSEGHAYPLNQSNSAPLSGKTIFEELQDNNISWKIYIHQPNPPCSTSSGSCLGAYSYLTQWQYYQTAIQNWPGNFESTDQLINDMNNGTLPQVSFVEPAGYVALDEHPTDSDVPGAPNVQVGANYAAGIVNTLMKSVSWKDSVFIFSYDEPGGFYDHVPPQPAVPPDAIQYPTDLQSPNSTPPQGFYDLCLDRTTTYSVVQTPVCGFFVTGFRVPLIVISPFTKKNYLSHTVMDYTAILKFIEKRFNLPSLTARDAAQPDMNEFFDFVDAPWITPPTPPTQLQNMACAVEALNAVTFSPTPAPAGGTATVTLSLSHNAFENVTVQLSASPSGVVVPASEPIASGTSSTSFTINVPTGITSFTVTGSIGGIPVSGTVPVQ
jgi:phospholipase C